MAFETFDYTRKWTDPNPVTGFKTYEDREDVVRADLQQLWDEVRDFINEKLVAKLNDKDFEVSVDADDVAFTPTPYINESDVQAAIENVQGQILAWMEEHAVPPNTVTGAMMVQGAVDTRELADDAVTEDKLHDDSVDYFHIKTDAVRRDAIMDGEVTNDKLAPGVLPNKADLVDGIVNPAQLRLRRIIRQLGTAVSTYDIALGDIGSYMEIDAWDVVGGISVNIPANSLIQPGSFLYLDCGEYVRRISRDSGVSLYVSGVGGVSSYETEAHEVLLFVKKSSSPDTWELIPFSKKVGTDDLVDGAVTPEKTTGLQERAKVIGKVYVPGDSGWTLTTSPYGYWRTSVSRTDSLQLDIMKTIVKPYCYPNGANTAQNQDIIAQKRIYLADITDTEFVFQAWDDPRGPVGVDFTIIGF